MMLRWTIALVLAAYGTTLTGQTAAVAINKVPKSFYQLTFVVKELEGDRVVNTRTYFTSASTHEPSASAIRAGEKISFALAQGANTTLQSVDVGVDIDCRQLEIVGDRLSLWVNANIESVAVAPEEKNSRPPIIRNNRWDAPVIVPLRRPTIIFSSEHPFSTQKIQLQLTVMPLQ